MLPNKTCARCKTLITLDNARFCTTCGYRLTPTSSPNTSPTHLKDRQEKPATYEQQTKEAAGWSLFSFPTSNSSRDACSLRFLIQNFYTYHRIVQQSCSQSGQEIWTYQNPYQAYSESLGADQFLQ